MTHVYVNGHYLGDLRAEPTRVPEGLYLRIQEGQAVPSCGKSWRWDNGTVSVCTQPRNHAGPIHQGPNEWGDQYTWHDTKEDTMAKSITCHDCHRLRSEAPALGVTAACVGFHATYYRERHTDALLAEADAREAERLAEEALAEAQRVRDTAAHTARTTHQRTHTTQLDWMAALQHKRG